MAAYDTLCPGCFVEKGKTAVCPHCGYDENERRSPLVLPHRTMLDARYLAGRVLGKPGGFGITYLGWDVSLETFVAIKEYLPRDLAGRDTDRSTVAPHSREDEKLFRYGLKQFLQEARVLAKFDHANVVRVRTFFEENDTAYLVMDYYKGITLEEYRKQKGGKIPEKLAMDIMMPVLDGLREVHAKGFLHRDIKPQNIYLTKDGRPILLDFGAARFAMGERSRSLSVVLTPGFAPYEQYHRRGKQGPWTDIYSCGVTLYNMVTGKVPPEAIERKEEDELVPPAEIITNISKTLNSAIIKSLAIEPGDRPQRMRDFQDMIMAETSEPPIKSVPIPEAKQKPTPKPEIKPKKESDHLDASTNITSVLKQYWKLILFCSIGWGIGGTIGFARGVNIIGFAIGGIISGLSAGLSIRKALSNFKVRYVTIVTAGFAIGAAIGGAIGFVIDPEIGWTDDYRINFTIGWAIGGAIIGIIIGIISGLSAGLSIRKALSNFKVRYVTIVTAGFVIGGIIGWAIGWAIGLDDWINSWAIGFANGFAIGGAIGGIISGLSAGLSIRKALSNFKVRYVTIVTAGFAIGAAIGGAIGGAIGPEIGGIIGGAIGFAITGAIGTTITIWQIEKAKSNSRRA